MKTAHFILTIAIVALATLTTAGSAEAGSPVVDRRYTRTFEVHGKSWDCFYLTLKRNQQYRVVVEHVQPEVYPAVYRPNFYDMKLRIKRYWRGHLKSDSGYLKGTGRVQYDVSGVHFGDRPFKFCVFNALKKDKRFRITVTPAH